ncbi:MAG: FAD-dependent oxidoreductase [Candidatus Manganitrophaceae bacterium]
MDSLSDTGKKKRLVIIGNGMAGVAVVEALLERKASVSITVFGDERHAGYNRILLSDVLSGKSDPAKIITHSKEWYAEQGVDLTLGLPVTAINSEAKSVTDAAGGVTPYDFLLLAVGGLPFVPPIPGREKEGVFVFRTMEETEQIISTARAAARSKEGEKKAVVVGGGLLGLEAARGLINHGVSVTVVHLVDRLMEQQLDPAGGVLLKREMERMGIPVILNATAAEIVGDGQVTGVRLTTGEDLPAGMVIVCTGIRPNLILAQRAGLKTNRGILVDDRMETSCPGIFAIGDVIEHRGKTYGLIAPIPDQTAVFIDAIIGEGKRRYNGTLCATTLKVAGVHLTSAGDFLGDRRTEELVYSDPDRGLYKKCLLRENRLVGFILLGDNRDGARLFGLLQRGEDLSAVKGSLLGISGAAEARSGVALLSDADLICNCNSVTKGAILTAMREKGLSTRDEVANVTKATTGCGSCTQLVDDLIAGATKGTPIPVLPAAGKPPVKTGPMALKTLDLEKVKQEGLGIDFSYLREVGTRGLAPEDYYRLKTYGICSQKHPGYFMLRVRVPGGVVTAKQLSGLADLAETHGRGWGHLTVRQSLELHWVRVEESLEIFEKLEKLGLSTRSACGHTLRNVTACPHGAIAPDGLIDVQPWARSITDYFVRRSDLINPTMPNRLNVFFAACAECAPEAEINDIGFVVVRNEKGEIGFNLWVGGSLGAHPMLGFKLKEFISLEEALPACQAIFAIHTKHGNRNKAKSRLKYLIDQWGRESFVTAFEKLFNEKKNLTENRPAQRDVPLPHRFDRERPSPIKQVEAMLIPFSPFSFGGGGWGADGGVAGVKPQRQRGFVRLRIAVPLGEIRAEQLAALGKIAKRFGNGQVHFTRWQDVELHWVPAFSAGAAIRALKRANLSLKGEEREPEVLACPGTEFCTLAVTNSQGAARDLIKHLRRKTESAAAEIDPEPLEVEKASLLRSLTIHISGCPNSCAKHQVADIGLAGTMTPVGETRRYSYQLYLGGKSFGVIRLGEMVRKGITEEMVVPTVEALLDIVQALRQPGERFQVAVDRVGLKEIVRLLDQRLAPLSPEAAETVEMVPDLVDA